MDMAWKKVAMILALCEVLGAAVSSCDPGRGPLCAGLGRNNTGNGGDRTGYGREAAPGGEGETTPRWKWSRNRRWKPR